MSKAARIATALWFLLAVIVFNVRFDWQARMAGHEFVASQRIRQHQGLPPLTINDAFRPLVRQAAVDGARWALPIAGFGALMIFAVSRRNA